MGKKDYFGVPLARDFPAKEYDLVPRPERFDDMVQVGAHLMGYQKAFREICRVLEGKGCAHKLLQWMILTNLEKNFSLPVDDKLLDAFVKILGDGKISVPEGHLIDHNPVKNGKLNFEFPPQIDPSLPRPHMQIISPSVKNSLGIQFLKFHIFISNMGKAIFTDQDFKIIRKYLGKSKIQEVPNSQLSLKLISSSHQRDGCLFDRTSIQKRIDGKETSGRKFVLPADYPS